eukprot:TRINITY_DN9977_c0_g1_i1.p1 TRINITY_DN9977_c0_g1~~TRINITY_DN9977_c0_g1_i1.p1  ORF type:complete len:444 (-),score=84.13 TRINITY_DN9977_c0_g1_i1:90-1235(-)
MADSGDEEVPNIFRPLDDVVVAGDDFEVDEDDSDIEDVTIQPHESVLLVARANAADEAASGLELNVYDAERAQLFLVNDIALNEFPLCATWICTGGKNYAAVGLMKQSMVELWDLDVMNAVKPAMILQRPAGTDESASVICLSWLHTVPTILISGAADGTVTVWNLTTGACEKTLQLHEKEVQSVALCPSSPGILASAGLDRQALITDLRAPSACVRYRLSADAEAICWRPNELQVFVSTEDGAITCLDGRSGAKLYDFQAHDKACCALSFTAGEHPLLVSSSPDRTVALWDVSNGARLIARRAMDVGGLLCVCAHPVEPLLIATGSMKGKVAVWAAADDENVQRVLSAPAAEPAILESERPRRSSDKKKKKKSKGRKRDF